LGDGHHLRLDVGCWLCRETLSKQDDAKPHCKSIVCDPQGFSLTHDAGSAVDVATVFFSAGGVLVASVVL
jgi:hypothetical protein